MVEQLRQDYGRACGGEANKSVAARTEGEMEVIRSHVARMSEGKYNG